MITVGTKLFTIHFPKWTAERDLWFVVSFVDLRIFYMWQGGTATSCTQLAISTREFVLVICFWITLKKHVIPSTNSDHAVIFFFYRLCGCFFGLPLGLCACSDSPLMTALVPCWSCQSCCFCSCHLKWTIDGIRSGWSKRVKTKKS